MKEKPVARRRGIFVKLLVMAVLGLLLAGAIILGQYQRFQSRPLKVPDNGLVYELKEGTSLSRLASDMQQLGIIRHPRFLVLLGRELDVAHRLQTGEYQIQPDMTPRTLLAALTTGDVIQHSLVIVEGQTFREILGNINKSETIEATLGSTDAAEIMTLLDHAGEHPEGRFLPDTYYFPIGTTDVAFLQRAYDAMRDSLVEAWEQREEGLPLKTPYEALILASIVEKETGRADERPKIAGVFIQRLRRGMRLQTDPTVIYGLGEGFDGNIRHRDLRTDTPYNTYTRDGLPPTPIAMPGVDALHAVMHPDENGYLYFVAKGNGAHYFSRTLQEHNQAVKKYQQGHTKIKLPDSGQQ